MPAPTIKDVAKAAGVSVATVSYVINDGPRTVTDETRERVRAAMNQLGYAPNASARRLRRQHNHVIGVALAGMSGRPGISDLYFLEVMRGISIAADRAGYDLMVFSNPKKLGSTEFYQYLAAQHMVDGLIAAGSTINPEGIALMNAAGTPAVLVGRQRSAADIRRVIYTYEADAFWAVSVLLERGHRRVGLFLNPLMMLGESQRLLGYQRALEAAGLPYDPALVSISDHPIQYPSLEDVRQLYTNAGATAMVTAPYAEVCQHLDALGLPLTVEAVTLDEESHLPHPGRIVAAVRLAKYEAGLKAVELVLRSIQGEDNIPAEVVLPSQYITYSDSTAVYL